MAGQFEAEIKAILDKGQAESDLNSFLNQKRKVDVEVNLKTGNVNIANFLNQLQGQFQRAGQQSGQSFSSSFNSAVGNINVKNAASQIADMQRTLKAMHFDHSSIDTITQNLTNMDVAIRKITTDLGSNGNIRIKVDGIDEIGRAVSVIKEFDSESGILARSGEKIVQSFDDISRVTSQANEWGNKLKQFETQFKSLLDVGDSSTNKLKQMFDGIDFSNITSQAALDDMIQKFKELQAYGNQLNSSMNKSWAGSAIEKFQSNVKDATKELELMEKKFENIGKADQFKQKFQDIRTALDEIANSNSPEQMIANYNKVKEGLRDLSASYREVSLEQKNAFLSSNTNILGNQIQAWMNNNTKAAKIYSQELQVLQQQLRNVSSSADLAAVKKSFQEIKSLAAAEGNLGKGVLGTLFSNMTKLSPLFGMGSMISVASRGLRAMWTDVVDLDTALVDLQKTTTMSSSELESFYKSSNDVAKQMGVSTKEIIEQAAAWSRLGYSSNKEATEMAKLSSQFAAISPGMDVDQATDGLVSVMKAEHTFMPCCIVICNSYIFNCR